MYDDIGPTLPCSKAILIHFLRRHSLIFDIIIFDSIMPSSLPSPSFFHFHRPPSYVVFLSSLDRPIGPTTSTSYPGLSLRFRPLSLSPILSFIIFSRFGTLHIRRSIRICAPSNSMSVPSPMPTLSLPHTSVPVIPHSH